MLEKDLDCDMSVLEVPVRLPVCDSDSLAAVAYYECVAAYYATINGGRCGSAMDMGSRDRICCDSTGECVDHGGKRCGGDSGYPQQYVSPGVVGKSSCGGGILSGGDEGNVNDRDGTVVDKILSERVELNVGGQRLSGISPGATARGPNYERNRMSRFKKKVQKETRLREQMGFHGTFVECSDETRVELRESRAKLLILENKRKAVEEQRKLDMLASPMRILQDAMDMVDIAAKAAKVSDDSKVASWAKTVATSYAESIAKSAPSSVPSFDSGKFASVSQVGGSKQTSSVSSVGSGCVKIELGPNGEKMVRVVNRGPGPASKLVPVSSVKDLQVSGDVSGSGSSAGRLSAVRKVGGGSSAGGSLAEKLPHSFDELRKSQAIERVALGERAGDQWRFDV